MKYLVTLRPDMNISLEVEANSVSEARWAWNVNQARLAVSEAAPDLDIYDFDVKEVRKAGLFE